MENWKKIKVGDIEQTKENSEILKKLLKKDEKEFDLQKIIDDIDTKIKTPRFDKYERGFKK